MASVPIGRNALRPCQGMENRIFEGITLKASYYLYCQ